MRNSKNIYNKIFFLKKILSLVKFFIVQIKYTYIICVYIYVCVCVPSLKLRLKWIILVLSNCVQFGYNCSE